MKEFFKYLTDEAESVAVFMLIGGFAACTITAIICDTIVKVNG